MATKSRRRGLIASVVAVAVLATGAYFALRRIPRYLAGSGCQAGAGRTAVSLAPGQAAIAATIAGVAHQHAMGARAVIVAYATALQESHLRNLRYGDRDSVGVFQQRPSEGWGTASELTDPVFAATRFFQALKAVHGYQSLPVYRAAQAVQRSADGYAYIQYERPARQLANDFTGRHPHAVWCWSASTDPRKANLAAAQRGLAKTFGPLADGLTSFRGDAPSMRVRATEPAVGWSVAVWLVTHAPKYHIREVRYAGLGWRASAGGHGWTRVNGAGSPGAVEAN